MACLRQSYASRPAGNADTHVFVRVELQARRETAGSGVAARRGTNQGYVCFIYSGQWRGQKKLLEESNMRPTSKILMMSTVAVLAGTLAAASQTLQPGGGAQEKGASSMSQGQPGKEQSGKELPSRASPNRSVQSNQGTRGQ